MARLAPHPDLEQARRLRMVETIAAPAAHINQQLNTNNKQPSPS
jgi:hypothetical protein